MPTRRVRTCSASALRWRSSASSTNTSSRSATPSAIAVERLNTTLANALATGAPIPPLQLVAAASYGPLLALPNAAALLTRSGSPPWPAPVDELLTQQIREPHIERELQRRFPRITPIGDAVSLEVQRQYEENPYPRWVMPPSRPQPVSIEQYLRREFPHLPADFAVPRDGADVLIAGCGTGLHSVGVARRFKEARLLAVDLSRASLGYAQRKTHELGLTNVDYAQADILELASIGRSFDLIEAGGVLHHLADPFAGWRVLLGLLRPGGVMRVALYSEIARRDVVAARAVIAEQGYQPTAQDIRRCRQALIASPLAGIARYYDFFSTSECRDLMFHVQEHRLGLPAIAALPGRNRHHVSSASSFRPRSAAVTAPASRRIRRCSTSAAGTSSKPKIRQPSPACINSGCAGAESSGRRHPARLGQPSPHRLQAHKRKTPGGFPPGRSLESQDSSRDDQGTISR